MSAVLGRVAWRLVFLGVFGVVLYLIGLVNWTEAEKSFRVERADVTVEVQANGSLRVTEELTYDFDGQFSGAYRDIGLAEGMRASNVQVSEAGQNFEPGGATGLGSFDRPGRFGTEELTISRPDGDGPTKGFRVVWHYRANSEDRTFVVSYDVSGATRAYDDVIYVPWAVWGNQWLFNLDDLRAEIVLADSDAEPADGWLRPRGLGVEPELAPGSVSVEAERLRAGEEAALTAVFPREAVRSVEGARVEQGDGLDEVLAEEAAVDDAQGMFSKAAAFVAANVIGVEIVWTVLVLLAAWWLYFRGREESVNVGEYMPEPPEDISPALAYAYAHEGEFDDRLVLATLLDLVDRGFYETKADEGEEMDLVLSIAQDRPKDAELEKFEQKTLDFFDSLLNDGGPCALGKLKDRIPEHSAKWRQRWESLTDSLDNVERGKLGWSRTFVDARTTVALVGFLGYLGILVLYFDRTRLVSVPLFAMVAGMLFIYLLPARYLKRMDSESRLRSAQWNAFAKWTKDFPRLADDPPATLILWRRILVYAVAFGTAERLIGSGRIPAPVVEEAMSSGLWVYPHLSGMDSGITPSFNAFASGFSSQVAPESSSSGGGGGFSGGGGGFGGGGGGGAW